MFADRGQGSTEDAARRSDPSLEIELEPLQVPRSVPPEVTGIGLLGGYELLGRIAVGGMAEIFLARQRAHGGSRQLVVKVVRPQLEGDAEFDEMFLNEGRVAMRLRHPNICHVYEFGLEHGRYFIAMEYVHGVTLRALVARAMKYETPVPAPLLVRVAAQVAEALDSAHQTTDAKGDHLGVVHRDVSPHNIMVGFDGVVKLLDFGVAKVTTSEIEESGTIKGKFGYLAPEQCMGQPVDGRADIFSLGVCLWEGLTGRRLYQREGEYETLHAIVKEPLPDLRKHGVDPDLLTIVERALEKKPEDRYQTGAEMQEALERWLSDRRELVNSARISRFVKELFAEEVLVGPKLDRRPELVAWIAAQDPSIPPPPAERAGSGSAASEPPTLEETTPRRSGAVFALLGLVTLLGLGGAAWYWWQGPGAPMFMDGELTEEDPATDEVAGALEAGEPGTPAEEDEAESATEAEGQAGPETAEAPETDPSEDETSLDEQGDEEGDEGGRRGRGRRRARAGGFVDDPGF